MAGGGGGGGGVFVLVFIVFILFISKYSCMGYIIDLMETLQTKYYESIFDIHFIICR